MHRRIKIDIGKRGKKTIFDKPHDPRLRIFSGVHQRLRVHTDALELIQQEILQIRDLRGLAAHPLLRAALAARRLLALITKHFVTQIHIIAHTSDLLSLVFLPAARRSACRMFLIIVSAVSEENMSAPAIFCCLIAFLCPFAIIYVNTMFMQ